MSDETNMLRRAATACRNAQSQMRDETAWFDWVPQHLDRLADGATPRPPSSTEGADPFAALKALPEWQALVAAFSLPPQGFIAAALSRAEALVAAVEGNEG